MWRREDSRYALALAAAVALAGVLVAVNFGLISGPFGAQAADAIAPVGVPATTMDVRVPAVEVTVPAPTAAAPARGPQPGRAVEPASPAQPGPSTPGEDARGPLGPAAGRVDAVVRTVTGALDGLVATLGGLLG